jgi:hypothetical protein
MSANDRRRHRRIPYVGPVCIFLDDNRGRTKYVHAKFLNISEGGLRIEAPEPLPVGAHISLRAERINLVGSAVVKHVVRCGSKYLLGLELSQTLREQATAFIRDPWTVRPPLPVAMVNG